MNLNASRMIGLASAILAVALAGVLLLIVMDSTAVNRDVQPQVPATNSLVTNIAAVATVAFEAQRARIEAVERKKEQIARAREEQERKAAAQSAESERLGLARGESPDSHRAATYDGSGTTSTVGTATDWFGSGPTYTYYIQVEDGLNVDASSFAKFVDRTLQDSRSWSGHGVARFRHIDGTDATFRIVLASPTLTDALCAPLSTDGIYSCRNGNNVVLNYYRWITGALAYPNDLSGYHTYMVNHEVGHAIGMDHMPCTAPGTTGPVMLQQSIGLRGCRANPWPLDHEAQTLR